MDEISYLSRRMLRVLLNYVLLLLVGGLDCLTGRDMHVGSLYLLVVAIASWNLCPRALIPFAGFTLLVWAGADRYAGVHYAHAWIAVWNAANRLGVLAITATMVFKAKTTLDRQQRLIRDLGQTLLTISQFKELVPVCRICHELHVDGGYRAKLDELLVEGVNMESIGHICPACLDGRTARVEAISVDSYFNSPVPGGSASRRAAPPGSGASPPRSAPPAAADGNCAP